jgi:hypothetical protein
MIAYLCLLSAEMDGFTIHKRQKKNYRAGEVFEYLDGIGASQLPYFSRLLKDESQTEQDKWNLNIEKIDKSDVQRLKNIYIQSNAILHEYSPFERLAGPNMMRASLNSSRVAMQVDHQWLWNRLWQHAFFIEGKFTVISLGHDETLEQPHAVKQEGLFEDDIKLDLDPELVADFSGSIDWSLFSIAPRNK